MEEYCKNCGAAIRDGAKFCPDCGSEIEKAKETIIENKNFCENCGSELSPGASFCGECGHGMSSALAKRAKPKDNNRTIIIGLVAVVAILLVAVTLFSGVLTPEVPLVTQDFGVMTMLIPEGSNYVETSSIPDYGYGGYYGMENAGDYSDEVYSIMISTIQGGSYPSGTVLDSQVGDITVYRDNQGENVYYIERDVGDYEVTLIGNNEDAMIKMLQSIELTD